MGTWGNWVAGHIIDEPNGDPIAATIGGVRNGGEVGQPYPIAFAHWNAPEWGRDSENVWNTVFAAAQLAIAIANSVAQQQIADRQQELANRWLSHAKYKWSRFSDNYMPLEKQLLDEVSTEPVPTLNCADCRERAGQQTTAAYDTMYDALGMSAKKYAVCMDSSLIRDMDLSQMRMLVDTTNYNYQDDRWLRDYLDDRRWNRRSQVLNIGRNTDAQAVGYGQLANSMLGKVGAQLNQLAGSAMYGLGYFGARNDTYMPSTYLGTGGQGTTGSVVSIGVPGNIQANNMNPSGGMSQSTGG